jgi:hypothetical protein
MIAAGVLSAFAMGMVPVLLRSLQPFLCERLATPPERLDRLGRMLVLSWLPLMPLAGWLVDHWGTCEVLFVGSLALAVAVSWLALCQNQRGLIWGLVGLALAGAFLAVAGTALMPTALLLSPRWSVGASLCLGYVFVAFAALATPAALPWTARRLGWPRTLLCASLLCLAPAAVVTLVTGEIAQPLGALVDGDASLYDVRFWLVALVAFLYFPLEASLEIWPRPYLAEIGYSGRTIVRLLAGFWCAFLVLRFGLGWMIRPGYEAWLVLVLIGLSSMVVGNLAGSYAPTPGYLGFWLLGACYGPILPALLAVLEWRDTRRVPGQTVGAVLAVSALSSVALGPVLLGFAKRHGPRESMRIPMMLGLIMAAPMLVLALLRMAR